MKPRISTNNHLKRLYLAVLANKRFGNLQFTHLPHYLVCVYFCLFVMIDRKSKYNVLLAIYIVPHVYLNPENSKGNIFILWIVTSSLIIHAHVFVISYLDVVKSPTLNIMYLVADIEKWLENRDHG